jgi:adenylate cyclase
MTGARPPEPPPAAASPAPASPGGPLPARVQAAIRAQQDASERLIGWIQLAVVTVFAALYAASPKTFAADAAFAPVPWALGVYMLFTVVRLALAYRGKVGPAVLYGSILLDMALLLGLIWSFHLQYQQPPSFYLKSPTLLYVFIFIALRALRFEARYVVAAGVVAAVGWFGLVAYAVHATHGEMVTRDYVHYMTHNAILIGAEFDKILSILLVTAIVAAAIARARGLLVRAVAEGQAARELSRFFAPEVAQRITGADEAVAAGTGQAREAAILFCDIRGFSRFAGTTAPGEVIAMLAGYQRRMVPIVRANGGTIDKFLGDGIMATFGATADSATYAADALRAVDGLMAEAARWNDERAARGLAELRIGAAVASGRIVFGAVGDETRLEYTVIGDAVNRAAKLEKATKEQKVRALTTRECYAAALAQGYAPDGEKRVRDARTVDGLDGPVDLVVLAE